MFIADRELNRRDACINFVFRAKAQYAIMLNINISIIGRIGILHSLKMRSAKSAFIQNKNTLSTVEVHEK
jgi:hypothetical protein